MSSTSLARTMGVFSVGWLLGCAQPAPRPPSPPPQRPPLAVEESCTPEGPYGPLPLEEDDDVYDQILRQEAASPYDETGPYEAEDPRAAARHEYEVGRRADSEERWQDAYAAFLESFMLRRHPYTAFALGKVALALGRHRDALRHLDFVLRSKNATSAQRADAEQWIKRARAGVGTVRVSASPQGSCVLADGLVVGLAPLAAPISLDAGVHRLGVRYQGEETTIEVSVSAPGEQEVTLASKNHR
ncbi:MAG: hypothetical protein R3B70_02755 [Polyangiaceae bacterium]